MNNKKPVGNEKTVFFTSQLSEMKKRPEYSDSLHSALHGPTAKNSDTDIWKDYLNLSQKPTALYLYHYMRFCVDRKQVEKSDACLFDRKKDASKLLHPHQLKSYNYCEGIMGALNCLRAMMGITEKMDHKGKKKYPPFKILTTS